MLIHPCKLLYKHPISSIAYNFHVTNRKISDIFKKENNLFHFFVNLQIISNNKAI